MCTFYHLKISRNGVLSSLWIQPGCSSGFIIAVSVRVGASNESIDASKTTLRHKHQLGRGGGGTGESAILIVQLRYLLFSNISGLAILVCFFFYHQHKKT